MITVADAIKRIQKNHPDQRIISGMDMGDFYIFGTMHRSVNPANVLEIPAGSTARAIQKNSGEEFLYHFLLDEGTPKGEIDVVPYLSSDDAAFAKKMKTMKENPYGSMEG